MDTEETGGGSNPKGGARQMDLFSLRFRKGRFFLFLKIKNAICNCNDSKIFPRPLRGYINYNPLKIQRIIFI